MQTCVLFLMRKKNGHNVIVLLFAGGFVRGRVAGRFLEGSLG